jgi:ABC-type phosphate transport system permease subunit
MKNKPRSKAMPDSKALPEKKNGAEEKLQFAVQKLRSNPSIIIGALIVSYCVIRLVFSV